MPRPTLDPPCSGWTLDLPAPGILPTAEPSLGFDTPNHQDDIFLEICRASSMGRGILTIFLPFLIYTLGELTHSVIDALSIIDLADFYAIYIPITLLTIWTIIFVVKFDIATPRDLPIRFNRGRQRIYAYNFPSCWWNPFNSWKTMPKAYDWSQVRAEGWKIRGVTAHGATIVKWGVVLSIVQPGTNRVIDRFPLTTMGADEFTWAYICIYMQQGPSSLPPPGPPRDHNAVAWYNLALRLAPKVKWPEEMDRESRTTC